MDIAERLRLLRKQKNMTQAAVAKACGVEPAALCKYEKGDRLPSRRNLFRLAEYYCVPVDYIIGSSGGKKTSANTLTRFRIQLRRMQSQANRMDEEISALKGDLDELEKVCTLIASATIFTSGEDRKQHEQA